MSDWISVQDWRHFQHYDPAKRQPPWIKVYTELMSSEAWLALSGNDRAVLCCLWLEYASSRCRLRADTRSLTRRFNLRVTTATLERLEDAGFIHIVASAALAEGYPSRAGVETETEKPKTLVETNLVRARASRAADVASANGTFADKLRHPERVVWETLDPDERAAVVAAHRASTGVRHVRGSHSATYVADPLGTDPVDRNQAPPGYDGRSTPSEFLAAWCSRRAAR